MKNNYGVLVTMTIIFGTIFIIGGFLMFNQLEDESEPDKKTESFVPVDKPEVTVKTSIVNDAHNLTLHFQPKNLRSGNITTFYIDGSWTDKIIVTNDYNLSLHFEELIFIKFCYWIWDGTSDRSSIMNYYLDLSNYGNIPPIAVSTDNTLTFYYDQQPVMLCGEGSFDPDGEIIGYYWDYGDGTHSDTSQGFDGYHQYKVVAHTYQKTGLYTAKLYVMDNDHRISEEPYEITIQIKSSRPAIP